MRTYSGPPRGAPFFGRARSYVPVHLTAVARARLARLPDTCEQILLLPVPDDDLAERAEIALRFLPYAEVMRLALLVPAVRSVVALLPADFAGWAR